MPREARIYVGNLPRDVSKRELDDLFYKFGRLGDIAIRSNNDSAFAFLTFDDERDAREAIRRRDQYSYDRRTLRVEFSKDDRRSSGGGRDRSRSRSRSRDRGDRGDRDRRGGGDRDRDRDRASLRNKPKRFEKFISFGLLVSGLPSGATWKDLKDFAKIADSAVDFADIVGNDEGILTFTSAEAFEKALEVLPRTDITVSRNGNKGPVVVAKMVDDPRYQQYLPKAESASASSSSASNGDEGAGGDEDKEDKADDRRDRSASRSRSRSRSNSPH